MSETAVFGGGCFWCTEAIFQRLKGVNSVTPGYAGGATEKPDYKNVSGGSTGHAEVIKIEFDPNLIEYRDLLDVFFATHDPTTIDKQGADTGSQYRSIILYADENQRIKSENKIKQLEKSGEHEGKIVTEVRKLNNFFEAEDYHHNYYNSNKGAPYCQVVINPKLEKLNKLFEDRLRN